MKWLPIARRTALTLALCAAFTAVNAKSFDQTGPAPSTLPALSTYGVDVPTRSALKSVVPAGWQLFVHKNAVLPSSMSWRTGVTWPQALSDFVQDTDIAVLVDWERKSVLFRPAEVALEDAAKRQIVAQAATTPLPTLSGRPAVATPELLRPVEPPKPAVDPAVVAELENKLRQLEQSVVAATKAKADAEAATSARVDSLEKALAEKSDALKTAQNELTSARESAKATESMVAQVRDEQTRANQALEQRIQAVSEEAKAARSNVLAASTPATRLPVPSALSPDAAVVRSTGEVQGSEAAPMAAMPQAQADMPVYSDLEQYSPLTSSKSFNRAAVRDVAQYLADIHGLHLVFQAGAADYQGPVTLLGADAGEDMRLMLKALGPASPVSFELFRDERVLRVVPTPALKRATASVAEYAYTGPLPLATQQARVAAVARETRATGPLAARVPTAVASHAAPPPVAPAPAAVPDTRPAGFATQIPAPQVEVPASTSVAASHPGEARAPDVASASLSGGAATSGQAPSQKLALRIAIGDDLQTAVTDFLAKQGYDTRWNVDERFEASSMFVGEGGSVIEVLSLLLPKLSLSADVQSELKLITVRPADAARDAR